MRTFQDKLLTISRQIWNLFDIIMICIGFIFSVLRKCKTMYYLVPC